MHFTCNQLYIKNTVTKKRKNNYCKKERKAKPSLRKRLESVHSFFSFYFTFLVFEVTPWLSFKGKVVLWYLFVSLVTGQAPAIPTAWRKDGIPACFVGLWHHEPARSLRKGRQRSLLCTSCREKSAAAFMCRTGFSHLAVYYDAMSKTGRPGLWWKNVGASQPESAGF